MSQLNATLKLLSLLLPVIISIADADISSSKDCYEQYPTTCRDPWLWPFSKDSIWNTPIGSEAQYIEANLEPAGFIGYDMEYMVKVTGKGKKQKILSASDWGKRWPGKDHIGWCELDDEFTIADAAPPHTPNACLAILESDGRTIRQLEPACRIEPGGHIVGYHWPVVDIYGPGSGGSHGASSLSTIGGSIRRGELIAAEPIRHAVKINIWAKKYLNYTAKNKGYRWPATSADSYAADGYKGSNEGFTIGTLLAIKPDVSLDTLPIKSEPGKKLFHALQDYGAYIPDDSAWDSHDLCIETGVAKEVKERYALEMASDHGQWHDEVNTMISLLHIVDNNSTDTIGGGGKPRAPLAPAFCCSTDKPAPWRIMPLGDSITEAGDPGYRGFLYNMLKDNNINIDMVGSRHSDSAVVFDSDHEGHGGFTIGPGKSLADDWTNGKGNIMVNIKEYMKTRPDIILLMIGTNDYFNIGDRQPGYDPENDGSEKLAALLDNIHEIDPYVIVLVASILPVEWDMNFAAKYNATIPELAKARKRVWFVNMNKEAGFIQGDWKSDKLHPTESGYKKVAGVWFDNLNKYIFK